MSELLAKALLAGMLPPGTAVEPVRWPDGEILGWAVRTPAGAESWCGVNAPAAPLRAWADKLATMTAADNRPRGLAGYPAKIPVTRP